MKSAQLFIHLFICGKGRNQLLQTVFEGSRIRQNSSMDVAVAAVLSGVDGIFILKEEQREKDLANLLVYRSDRESN